jgi:hypothetical protein
MKWLPQYNVAYSNRSFACANIVFVYILWSNDLIFQLHYLEQKLGNWKSAFKSSVTQEMERYISFLERPLQLQYEQSAGQRKVELFSLE